MIESSGDKLFTRALQVWDQQAQLSVVKEELAELIVAISHCERSRIGLPNLIGEIADVRIMLRQIMVFFNVSDLEVDASIKAKLDRLSDRLSEIEKRKK